MWGGQSDGKTSEGARGYGRHAQSMQGAGEVLGPVLACAYQLPLYLSQEVMCLVVELVATVDRRHCPVLVPGRQPWPGSASSRQSVSASAWEGVRAETTRFSETPAWCRVPGSRSSTTAVAPHRTLQWHIVFASLVVVSDASPDVGPGAHCDCVLCRWAHG